MINESTMQDRYVADFAENYMEKLFYFCLKKTGDSTDAQDLTQDIALNVITALNKGTVPPNFPAWVWQIARNRYSVWADEKHRRVEAMTGVDIGDYEIEDESASVTEATIREEQMSFLRRELAFIRGDYRNVIVAYYLENRSVHEIASTLGLSVSAVHQRLHRARNLLKEGMDMAREFGIRSYKPEEINFVKNGSDGKKGQPWSIVGHLLYKNIFLQAYENPQTAEQLALELGIALPYMVDELEFLVREQLMRKEGDKYQTDFRITSREEQRAVYDANILVQKPLTEQLCEMLDLYMKEDGAQVNVSYIGYENAKWALLMRLFDALKWERANREQIVQNPSRPDDGSWTLFGYQTIDWEEPGFVGQHGAGNIAFWQYKFFYKQLFEQTPMYLNESEAFNLWLFCSGKQNECEQKHVDKLLEYGYIKRVNGVLTPNVVIFDQNAKACENVELTETLRRLIQEISALFAKAPAIERGYVLEQAIENGWLTYDENTDRTVGAYIYL